MLLTVCLRLTTIYFGTGYFITIGFMLATLMDYLGFPCLRNVGLSALSLKGMWRVLFAKVEDCG